MYNNGKLKQDFSSQPGFDGLKFKLGRWIGHRSLIYVIAFHSIRGNNVTLVSCSNVFDLIRKERGHIAYFQVQEEIVREMEIREIQDYEKVNWIKHGFQTYVNEKRCFKNVKSQTVLNTE